MIWDVDLSDPSRLAFLLDGYLALGVVPVEGPPPAVLAEGTLHLRLPGGRVHEGVARVIRASGPGAFLVQADGLPDVATLRTLSRGEAAPPPPPAKPAPGGTLRDSLDDMLATLDTHAQVVFPGALESPPPAARPATRIERTVPPPVAPAPSPSGFAPRPAPAVPDPAVLDLEVLLAPPVPSRGAAASPAKAPPGEPSPLPAQPAPSPAPPAAPVVSGRETEYSDAYAKVKDLPLLEKQRLARHGRRTVRQILMRDPNKTLQRVVLGNPDVGLDEVQEYAAWPGLCKEALEFITTHTTWMASRQLTMALVRNPSTPIELAIRLVPRLGPAEWRLLVRPGTVRTPVATAARKALETARES